MTARYYRLLMFTEPRIGRDMLAAHIDAEAYEVVHDQDASVEEKVAGLHALAALARSLSDYWAQTQCYYGPAAERRWFRACGIGSDGEVSPDVVRRAAETGGHRG